MKRESRVIILLLCFLFMLGCAKEPTYRLYVNDKPAPVDTQYRESAKGEVMQMAPIVALFKGLGCTAKTEGDLVTITKGESFEAVLDLEAHTLYDPKDPDYNYFTLCPGDTKDDFKVQRVGNELWVCTHYIDSAFQLMGKPIARITRDDDTLTVRITLKDPAAFD